jgi:queuosine precursor transporter
MFSNKSYFLFLVLAGFFIANALVAEFMGVKVFSLESTFGNAPVDWTVLGIKNLSFNLSAGVLLWPIVFVTTDVINEYFGQRGVRMLSYFAVALIAYSFLMLFWAIHLAPADFWVHSHLTPNMTAAEQAAMQLKVGDYNAAFSLVFGQSLWIIAGSLVAFLFGQLVDVFVFHQIKKRTGERNIWLRATGSTLVSQFIDSFVVLFIAFYIGAGWSLNTFLAVALVNYSYKFCMALLMTPVVYFIHFTIERYLGEELASKLKYEAAGGVG